MSNVHVVRPGDYHTGRAFFVGFREAADRRRINRNKCGSLCFVGFGALCGATVACMELFGGSSGCDSSEQGGATTTLPEAVADACNGCYNNAYGAMICFDQNQQLRCRARLSPMLPEAVTNNEEGAMICPYKNIQKLLLMCGGIACVFGLLGLLYEWCTHEGQWEMLATLAEAGDEEAARELAEMRTPWFYRT